MQTKKIESNILLFIIIQSIFLLFFFKESLLNIILGSIIGFVLIKLYDRLKINNKNLVLKVILMIILLLSSLFILKDVTNFIEYNILKDYSRFILGLSFTIICTILSYKGYHSYIKSLELSSYIIAFLGIASILLLVNNIDIDNFNIQVLKETSFNYHFISISMFIFFSYLTINYLNGYHLNNKVYFGSIFSIILLKLLTIGILGETLLNLYDYPYISILKRIEYLDFVERMEGVLSLQYLFCFFFLFSLVLLTIRFLLTDLFKIKKDKVINITLSIISLFIFLISYIIL